VFKEQAVCCVHPNVLVPLAASVQALARPLAKHAPSMSVGATCCCRDERCAMRALPHGRILQHSALQSWQSAAARYRSLHCRTAGSELADDWLLQLLHEALGPLA
jgi:hypothetical protein